MSELIALPPQDENQDTPKDTSSMVLMEVEQGEPDLGAEIQRLKAEYEQLRPLQGAAAVLEMGILTGGLLDASERYGADRVVSALGVSFGQGGKGTLHETYTNLIPDRTERKRFITSIDDQDSGIHAIERINEIGGVQGSSWDMSDQFDRARRFDAAGLAARKQRPHGPRHTMTQFDNSYSTPDFSDAMFSQPELFQQGIVEDGDIVDVLEHVRTIYAEGEEAYSREHARIAERIEVTVAERQRPVQALRDLSDSLLANEIQRLESTLNDIDDEAQRSLIATMLEERASSAQAKRAEFDEQLKSIRDEVLRDLDAEYFDSRTLHAPVQPRLIHDTRDRHNATSVPV